MKIFNKKQISDSKHTSLTIKISISYTLFLLLCLILSVCLYNAALSNSKEGFWHQNKSVFQSSVHLLDNNFSIMDSYCRQLTQTSDFVHLSIMNNNQHKKFYMTAMKLKNNLPSHLYSYSSLPINSYFIYLRNSQYVLSVNAFESESLYYVGRFQYPKDYQSQWHSSIYADNQTGTMYSLSDYIATGDDDAYLYLVDMDQLTYKDIPATAGFHISFTKMKRLFAANPLGENGFILATDSSDQPAFFLSDASSISENSKKYYEYPNLEQTLTSLEYTNNYANITLNEVAMHITRFTSEQNDWVYYLVQPDSLCITSFSNYSSYFILFLVVAVTLGLLLVIALVKNNMRPIHQLDSELKEVISDRDQLQEVVDSTKPIICDTYIRQLMQGSVVAQSEFDYIRQFLHLDDQKYHYYVLYSIIYDNIEASDEQSDEQSSFSAETSLLTNTDAEIREKITAAMFKYFSFDSTLYVYMPENRVFAVLLPFADTADDVMISIQDKVLKLHEELMQKHSIWLYAGIGRASDSLANVWESFQQAKEASGYTGKNYIFLPYEMIKKDSHVYYYPQELSSKLIHFISSGNKPQIMELFNLIHQENIEERSLPLHLLKFLLSDIRNTLLKARFSITATEQNQAALQALDTSFMEEHLTFRSCEDIALSLCEIFSHKAEENNLIDTIVSYIKEKYQDPSICLSKISDEFNISESYFSHMFKENMGLNFSVYLENMRLNEAASLMQQTDVNLSEIYLKVGYNNVTSFRRAFKKKFGITPSEMKNN